MARRVEHGDARQHFALVFDRLEDAAGIGRLDAEDAAFIGAVVERQRIVGHFDLGLGRDVAGISELFHVLHMIPVQMGEDDGVDLVWMNAELLLQMIVHLQTAALIALVVIPGGAFLVAESGVDQDLVYSPVST